jgi:hypothetical protein
VSGSESEYDLWLDQQLIAAYKRFPQTPDEEAWARQSFAELAADIDASDEEW